VNFGTLTNSARIIESQETFLNLTSAQATQLSQLGRDLASNSSWWGEDTDADPILRNVVSVVPDGTDRYRVRVQDCVGVIALSGFRIYVEPKIPIAHFNYIASFAISGAPRGVEDRTTLEAGDGFLGLVANWFIEELFALVRKGLQRGYVERQGSLPYVTGSVDILRSLGNLAKGRLELEARFEDFSFNTWQNRLLATALKSPLLDDHGQLASRNKLALVKRYFRDLEPLHNLSEVLDLEDSPLHYRAPLSLALSLLIGNGRALSDGNHAARSFLIRTPLLVESGIRRILQLDMAPTRIAKGGRQLVPTALRVSPDIEATEVPYTADVKYKVTASNWRRPDLAQAVFFATAYASPIAAVISFDRDGLKLPDVPVGNVRVASLVWDISPGSQPLNSAKTLVSHFSSWLTSNKFT
jgi:hypothetical protein